MPFHLKIMEGEGSGGRREKRGDHHHRRYLASALCIYLDMKASVYFHLSLADDDEKFKKDISLV